MRCCMGMQHRFLWENETFSYLNRIVDTAILKEKCLVETLNENLFIRDVCHRDW